MRRMTMTGEQHAPCREPGTWNLEPGTWNLEPRTWNLEPPPGVSTPDRRFLAANRRRAQRADDRVGQRLRHFDEREAIRHLDLADISRGHARFAGDRTDQIARLDARRAAEAHEESRHRACHLAPGRPLPCGPAAI